MKNHFTLTALLLAALITANVNGQTYDSVCHHHVRLYEGDPGIYDLDMRNLMELRDGGLVANVQVFGLEDGSEYGNQLYKLEYRSGDLAIVDSAFVEDHDLCNYLLARNPLGDDNVYAKIVRDFDSCRSYLQIEFFDDDLVFDLKKEVIVPLEDTLVWWSGQMMIDPHDDIVLSYLKQSGGYYYYWLVRVGLDGTVKQKVCVSQSEMYTSYPHPLAVLDTSPLEFAYWGSLQSEHPQFRSYTLDSLFQVTDTFLVWGTSYWEPGSFDQMAVLNDGSFLVAMRFAHWPPAYSDMLNGVVVAKFDRESHGLLTKREFLTDPFHLVVAYGVPGTLGKAFPFGLAQAADGNVYMAYNTQDRIWWPEGWVSIVKMTPGLEVIWQRYFLEPMVSTHYGMKMVPLELGGVVVGVVESELMNCSVSFIVVDDEGVGVTETAAQVRPYLFYPNPATDELFVRWSPDVQPEQMALYDMQGRLVRAQGGGMERMGLEGLAPGLYTLRVTLADGSSYTDKVVKR